LPPKNRKAGSIERNSAETTQVDAAMAKTSHNSELKALLTIKQVADLENVSPRTVRRWIKTGELAVYRTGGIIRVCPDVVRARRLRRLVGGD
jgi:excisionase family DNA binding protein